MNNLSTIEENIKNIERDVEDMNDDIKLINCNPILLLIKHSLRCLYDSFKLFFICFKKKSE